VLEVESIVRPQQDNFRDVVWMIPVSLASLLDLLNKNGRRLHD